MFRCLCFGKWVMVGAFYKMPENEFVLCNVVFFNVIVLWFLLIY